MIDLTRPAQRVHDGVAGLVGIAEQPEVPGLVVGRGRPRVVAEAQAQVAVDGRVIDRQGLTDQLERPLIMAGVELLERQHAKRHAARAAVPFAARQLAQALGVCGRTA